MDGRTSNLTMRVSRLINVYSYTPEKAQLEKTNITNNLKNTLHL